MRKIKLLKEYNFEMFTYNVGEIHEEHEPFQGFNEDGTFTICQGMDIYNTIKKEDFEEIFENDQNINK